MIVSFGIIAIFLMRLENIILTFARVVTVAKRGTIHAFLYDQLSLTALEDVKS